MVSRPRRQRGVTYLALLFAVAITSGLLAASASLWSQVQRREREKQLLWAGDQIRRAIVAYSQSATNAGNRYPATLQDLLLDARSAAPRRYLRQVYDDPMTRGTDWGLLRNPQGRIVGVYSQSDGAPVKTAGFPAIYAGFESAVTYNDWKFTAVPQTRSDGRPSGAAAAASSPITDRASPAASAGSAAGPGGSAGTSTAPARAPAKDASPQPNADGAASAPASAPAPPPEAPPADTAEPTEPDDDANRN